MKYAQTKRLHILILLLITHIIGGCKFSASAHLEGFGQPKYHYVIAKASGLLKKMAVTKGQTVHIGETLFSLDPQPEQFLAKQAITKTMQATANLNNMKRGKRQAYLNILKAQINQKEASKNLAQKQYRRRQILHKEQASSTIDLDLAKQQLMSATAQQQAEQFNLEYNKLGSRAQQILAQKATTASMKFYQDLKQTQLDKKFSSATISGIVANIFQYPGQYVSAFSPILSILEPHTDTIIFYATPSIISTFKLGQTVRFHCKNCQDQHQATIFYIAKQPRFTPDLFYDPSNYDKLSYKIKLRVERSFQGQMTPWQKIIIEL